MNILLSYISLFDSLEYLYNFVISSKILSALIILFIFIFFIENIILAFIIVSIGSFYEILVTIIFLLSFNVIRTFVKDESFLLAFLRLKKYIIIYRIPQTIITINSKLIKTK